MLNLGSGYAATTISPLELIPLGDEVDVGGLLLAPEDVTGGSTNAFIVGCAMRLAHDDIAVGAANGTNRGPIAKQNASGTISRYRLRTTFALFV